MKLFESLKKSLDHITKHYKESGELLSSDSVKKERSGICEICGFLAKNKIQCKACGCLIVGKVAFAGSKCPEGKW